MFQRIKPLFSWSEARWYKGRHGASRARSSTSGSTGNRKRHEAWFEHLVSQSMFLLTHFLWHGHTYTNKEIPPQSFTPYEPTGAIFIQTNTQRPCAIRVKLHWYLGRVARKWDEDPKKIIHFILCRSHKDSISIIPTSLGLRSKVVSLVTKHLR